MQSVRTDCNVNYVLVLIGLVAPGSFCLRKAYLLGEGSFRHGKAQSWLIWGYVCLGLAVVLIDLIWFISIPSPIVHLQAIGPFQPNASDLPSQLPSNEFSDRVYNLAQAVRSHACIGGIVSCIVAFIFAKVGIRQLTVYGVSSIFRLLAVLCLMVAVVFLADGIWSLGVIVFSVSGGLVDPDYAPLSRLLRLLLLIGMQVIGMPYLPTIVGIAFGVLGIVIYKQRVRAMSESSNKLALMELMLAAICVVLLLDLVWFFASGFFCG